MELILLILGALLILSLTILWCILPVIVFRMSQKMDKMIELLNEIYWNTHHDPNA